MAIVVLTDSNNPLAVQFDGTGSPIMAQILAALQDLAVNNAVESVDLSSADYVPNAANKQVQVGTGGTLKIDTATESGKTLTVVDGQVLSLKVTKIYKTGTTADKITLLRRV